MFSRNALCMENNAVELFVSNYKISIMPTKKVVKKKAPAKKAVAKKVVKKTVKKVAKKTAKKK